MPPRKSQLAAVPDTPTIAGEVSSKGPEFALWDDGRLCIYDGDEILQLNPADTARLARLITRHFQQPATA